ncbi:MAG: hypothetical protein V3T23_06330 [Nitrososphaerales archaeon]
MPTTTEHGSYTQVTSDIVTVATTITLDGIDVIKPHCFAGVQFFTDGTGGTPATPGAGTVTITVKTINSTPIFEAVPSNVIDATDIGTVSFASNTTSVRALPAGVTTATHYRMVVTCNLT